MELNLIGDLMIDEYKFYTISRKSPEAPVPVLHYQDQMIALGGSANLAACLSTLGYKVNLFGVCSNNSFRKIKSLCNEKNLSTDLILHDNNFLTTKKLRILGNDAQICRIDQDSFLDEESLKVLSNHVEEKINKKIPIALSDYAKGVSNIFIDNKIIDKPKYVDPKYPDWQRYSGCTFMKANDIEFRQALKFSKCKNAHELMKNYNIANLIVTNGKSGCSFYTNGKKINIKGISVNCLDVTGAGDSFMASFIWANEFGFDVLNSMLFANASAAYSVTKLGAYSPNFYEILSILPDDLKIQVNKDQKYNKIIVGGCFDCLHAGHVYLLKEALKLAKNVIVAINSDSSVYKIKGKGRPYQNLEKRMNNIKKLGFVSDIIPFDNISPKSVLEDEMPDAFIKGGDYSGKEDYEDFTFCRKKNIDIKIIPIKKGYSTSRILDEIL